MNDVLTHAALAKRYAQGASLPDLAEEFGLPFSKVRTILLDAGVSLRGLGPAPRRIPPQLGDRYKAGASIAELADMYGMSYGMTRRMLLREQVVLRPRGGDRRARADRRPVTAG